MEHRESLLTGQEPTKAFSISEGRFLSAKKNRLLSRERERLKNDANSDGKPIESEEKPNSNNIFNHL